jgi:hypothetical protein
LSSPRSVPARWAHASWVGLFGLHVGYDLEHAVDEDVLDELPRCGSTLVVAVLDLASLEILECTVEEAERHDAVLFGGVADHVKPHLSRRRAVGIRGTKGLRELLEGARFELPDG